MGSRALRGAHAEEAIQVIADLDAEKWGEAERPYSVRLHRDRTIGLAINELANRCRFAGLDDRAAAKARLTRKDLASLRDGG